MAYRLWKSSTKVAIQYQGNLEDLGTAMSSEQFLRSLSEVKLGTKQGG
jgi:hypothetical protein